MKILIVSATLFEVKLLVEKEELSEIIPNRLSHFNRGQLQVDLLTTGIGMVPAAFHLGKQIQETPYDFALNVGICGAYNHEVPLGSVLHVVEEQLPEAGVDENGIVRSLFELGLMSDDEYPFQHGKLVNEGVAGLKAIDRLKRVIGNTVNTMLTDQVSIDKLTSLFPADVESMEGAAFLFGCLAERIPCAQIRAVSNYVGERDKKRWEIRKAINNLDSKLTEILEEMKE
jgi:futalosine hydrolase